MLPSVFSSTYVSLLVAKKPRESQSPFALKIVFFLPWVLSSWPWYENLPGNNKLSPILPCLCCWRVTFEYAKPLLSRFWLPTTAVWCTRRPPTSHEEGGSISWTAVACEELPLSASEVKTFSWGLYFASFCVPQISTNFDYCSTSNSRCRPLLRTCRRPI